MTVQAALSQRIEGCGTALRLKGTRDRDDFVWFDNFHIGLISINGRQIKLHARSSQSTETELTAAYTAEGIEVRQHLERRQISGEELAHVTGELRISQGESESKIKVDGETGC